MVAEWLDEIGEQDLNDANRTEASRRIRRARRIAERAEIGKGTIYKHFSSKDELLFRLTLRFYSGLLDELKAIDTGADAADAFRSVIHRALTYHAEHREYRYVVEYCDRSVSMYEAAGRAVGKMQAPEGRAQ